MSRTKFMGSMSDRLDGDNENHFGMYATPDEYLQMELDRNRVIKEAITELSGAIKELVSAVSMQKPPVVLNIIANNDDDLQKLAAIFTQGIK